MYGPEVRREARRMMQSGLSFSYISGALGINRSTLRDWRDHPEKDGQRAICPRCASPPSLPEPGRDYAYLLGLYLGDGCISASGDGSRDVWRLRIACADAWPGLVTDCKNAISAIRPGNKVGAVQSQGCKYVTAYARHWPCLFPQHGPGKKHDRMIELAPWQRVIATQHPDALARGLFHSDGCRIVNRVRRRLGDGDRWYEYPRYLFTNQSRDILAVCGEMLDQLGIEWRYNRRNSISVARRESVARLDEFVGPKY